MVSALGLSYICVQVTRPEEMPPARVPAILPGPTQHSRGFPRNKEATSPDLSRSCSRSSLTVFSEHSCVSQTGQRAAPPTPEFVLLFLLSPPYTAFAPQLVRTRPERVGTTVTTRIPQGKAELRFLTFPELMKKV